MASKRVNVKAILADADLRRKLMVSTIQATQAREGIETSPAQADRAYYVVTEAERAAFFELERFKGGKKGEQDKRHEMFVKALRGEELEVRHDIARRDFAAIDGSPLAFERVGIVAPIFRESPALEPALATAAQGLANAADDRFVRCRWEVLIENVGQGSDWVPFAKGGEFSRFYADIHLVVDWKKNGDGIRNFDGAYIRNEQHYFKPGMTWPLRTQRGFNLRVMPEGCIFGHKGPAVLPADPSKTFFILGIANSAPAEFLLRGLMSFGSWEVGVIKRLPVPQANAKQAERVASLAKAIHDAKREWDSGNEISTSFERPWITRRPDAKSVSDALDGVLQAEASAEKQIQVDLQRPQHRGVQALRHPRRHARADREEPRRAPARGDLAADGGQDHRAEADGARLAPALVRGEARHRRGRRRHRALQPLHRRDAAPRARPAGARHALPRARREPARGRDRQRAEAQREGLPQVREPR
jgi:hypothetical protein